MSNAIENADMFNGLTNSNTLTDKRISTCQTDHKIVANCDGGKSQVQLLMSRKETSIMFNEE